LEAVRPAGRAVRSNELFYVRVLAAESYSKAFPVVPSEAKRHERVSVELLAKLKRPVKVKAVVLILLA
jgi:hypothetical protein